MDLFTLLDDAARKAPDAPALITDQGAFDYRQALGLVETLAAALHTRGVRPGDRVASLCANTPEHYVAYFATARLGAILVPLNWRLSQPELANVLRHAGARILLHESEFAGAAAALSEAAERILDVQTLLAMGSDPERLPPPCAQEDDVAQLYYTSGTTGDPKGVMLTHGNVGAHAAAAVQELRLGSADRWGHIAPMFHLADAWATFAITQAGGAHVFLPRFTPAAALDLLARHEVTITNLVPTMLNLMVKDPSVGSRAYALRAVLSGGAPIAPEIVRQTIAAFCCEYVQTYGMTETSPYLTLSLLDDAQRQLPAEERMRLVCRTGRPFLGVDLKVVHDDGTPVRPDDRDVGEIRVRGRTVTKGYWQNPEATRAAFDEGGYLCTGDLAVVDAHGFVNIVDRKKDVIKTGGESVFSTEVENVLYQHPAILECAVYGQPDPLWGEIVAAAIVLRPGANADAEELIAFCRARIAHYKAPRAVRFVPELPKTGSGKVQKRRLREG